MSVSRDARQVAALRAGEFQRVVDDFPGQRILGATVPTHAELHNLAVACYKLGRHDDARDWVARALEADPDHPRTRQLSGLLYLEGGGAAAAIPELERWVELDRASARPRLLLAVAEYRVGHVDRAAQGLELAIERAPDWALAHYDLALVRVRQGAWDEAVRLLARFAELERCAASAVAGLFAEIGRAAAFDQVSRFGRELKSRLAGAGDSLRAIAARAATAPAPLRADLEQQFALQQRLHVDVVAFLDAIELEPLRLDLVDVARLIDACLSIALRNTRHLDVTTSFPRSLPELIADPRSLRAALLDVILRAADAMPDAGSLRIAGTDAGTGEVRIVVEDTGRALSEQELASLFEPGGLEGGLVGLFQAARAVRAHGGRVEVESGRAGTRCAITLPIAPRAGLDLGSLELRLPLVEDVGDLLVE